MNAVKTDKRIKRYELLEEVGRGGMAVVYRGLDTALDRVVAVKVLHPHLASRADSARRFHREARAVARLRHRNIVEIYDTSSADDSELDQQFIVTEFVDGGTLRDIVEDGTGVPFPCVGVALVLELCDALEHAHELGIIHRDIKPENVMVSGAGSVKLMDFGIAQVLDADRMTASGSLLGSPAHMPPEIVDGQVADFRSDIFSLGTVLYYVTCNALPFAGNSPTAVLRNIMESRYEEPARANPRIGRRLAGIIRRCLQTEPDDRYQTVGELAAVLRTELDSLGLEDPAALVRDFLRDPASFEDRFRPAHVERMLERAQAAVDDNEVACATDWINRVLAVEVGNERALDLLERLGNRRRNRMIAIGVAVCVLLLGVGWVATWLAGQRTQHSEAATTTANPVPPETTTEVRTNPPVPVDETAAPELSAVQAALRQRLADGVDASLATLAPVRDWIRGGLHGLLAGDVADDTWRSPDVIAAATPSVVPSRRIERERPERRDDDEDSTAEDDATDTATVVDPVEVAPPAPTTVDLSFTVYPNDAQAWLSGNVGRRYDQNDQGYIVVPLTVGRHKLVVGGGPVREQYFTVNVTPEHLASGKAPALNARNHIKLDWSDGRVNLDYPGHYFFVRVDRGDINLVPVAGPHPISASFFGTFGDEVEVEVWAVPSDQGFKKPKESALRDFERRTVAIGPGQTKRIDFD